MKKSPAEKAAAKMSSIAAQYIPVSRVRGYKIEFFTRTARGGVKRTYWRVDGQRRSKFDVLAFLTELYTKE